MATQVRANIEIGGGKKIAHYKRLVIDQYMTKLHTFRIDVPYDELEKKDEMFFHEAHKKLVGKTVTITFEPLMEKGSYSFEFNGIITEIILRNDDVLSNGFSIRGKSPDLLMEDSIQRRSFLGKKLQQIFEAVMDDYPGNLLKKSLKPKSSTVLKYTAQYDESNYQFLKRLASQNGEWFYFDGKKIILGDSGGGKEQEYLVNSRQHYQMWVMVARPAKFQMESYDYTKDKTYKGKSSSQQVEGLSQINKFAMDESESLFSQDALLAPPHVLYAQNELDDYIKIQRSAKAATMVVFEGWGENPNISIGNIISVTGTQPQKDDKVRKENFGKYRITEIKHSIDENGNYENEFVAVPESLKISFYNGTVNIPVAHSELAVVTDNSDPDKLGRVKVDFFWPGSDKSSDWLRVGTFYAGGGDGKGMQFIPEKDAQVIVGYERGNPDMPFVMTSLYPKKDGTRPIKGSNEEKIIYTKAGNQFMLIDKQGENSIEITNVNKTDTTILIEFKDNGKISIKTKGKISIEAQETITIKATDKISMEAKDIEIKASNELKCEGTSKVSVKGAEVKMEADATMEIKGGATAKMASPMTEVSADGILTVKGSLVKIN